jgi:hypothetical protein
MKALVEWQHSIKYAELSDEQMKTFFDGSFATESARRAASVFGRCHEDTALTFYIDKPIVVNVLGDLLFDPDDDEDAATRERFLDGFVLQEPDADDPTSESERYMCSVVSAMQFDFIFRIVRCGLSFRQTGGVIEETRESSGITAYAKVGRAKVSWFVRVCIAANLMTLAAILRSCWGFSIALDGGNSSNSSYLDVRVRVCIKGNIYNWHLAAIPMRGSHTGERMFSLIATLLDSLGYDRRKRLIGATSDGASSMTGRYQGVVTRLQQVAPAGFYRIWCAAHQLDLVVKRVFHRMCDESFVNLLAVLSDYLRCQ